MKMCNTCIDCISFMYLCERHEDNFISLDFYSILSLKQSTLGIDWSNISQNKVLINTWIDYLASGEAFFKVS